MADSPLFQALHMEMAHALCADQEKGLGALEGVGFRVGQGLSERLTKEMPSFKDELDVVKFLCKDLWINVFKKQVDNLRTNHQEAAAHRQDGHGPPLGTTGLVAGSGFPLHSGNLHAAGQSVPPPKPAVQREAVPGRGPQVSRLYMWPCEGSSLQPGLRQHGDGRGDGDALQ
ncbi:trafficking protein particle complex subunit 6A isoform X1 [Pelodiscus sinensis]|uniref:trafficking protein particle complex subunit 6A isoform X1 n=1 Tax=Pelodiscus sinensis TaxID=13735 RepID=UPI003F6C870C